MIAGSSQTGSGLGLAWSSNNLDEGPGAIAWLSAGETTAETYTDSSGRYAFVTHGTGGTIAIDRQIVSVVGQGAQPVIRLQR